MQLRTSAVGVALALTASAAAAQEAGTCSSAYEQTQRLRRSGKLLEARQNAIDCSAPTCPEVLTKDCARWVAEIEPAIPRVVLSVKDTNGAPLTDVVIYLDGERLNGTGGGQSIEVNPGEHLLRFEHGKEKAIEKHAVFVEGEKNNRVTIVFGSTSSLTQPDAPLVAQRSPPWAALVATGLSVAALVTSAVFGVRALQQKAALDRADCKPRCNPSAALALQRSAAFADVAAGVAVVAAGSAVYLFFSNEASAAAPARPAPLSRQSFVGLGLRQAF